jgi:hypothetical protein
MKKQKEHLYLLGLFEHDVSSKFYDVAEHSVAS